MVLLLHPGGSWILDLHNCLGLCLLGGLWLIIVFQPLIKLFELVTCLRYIRSPEESLLQLDRDVLVLGEELVLASGCTSATLVHIAMLTLSAWGSWQGSCVIPDLDPSSWILEELTSPSLLCFFSFFSLNSIFLFAVYE